MKRYAIGDIHGCQDTFKALLKRIELTRKDELVLLGDYVDRGPDSKGVLDYIFQLQREGFNVKCLRGNHEQILLDSFHDNEIRKSWIRHGGVQTLQSFDVALVEMIPQKYIDFMSNLPFYYEADDYIFVHGGLNFRKANPFDDLNAMMWQRYWYDDVNYHWLNGRKILHGHTPIPKSGIEILYKDLNKTQYLNLDCGCFKINENRGMGYLTAFETTEQNLFFQKCIDVVEFVLI